MQKNRNVFALFIIMLSTQSIYSLPKFPLDYKKISLISKQKKNFSSYVFVGAGIFGVFGVKKIIQFIDNMGDFHSFP